MTVVVDNSQEHCLVKLQGELVVQVASEVTEALVAVMQQNDRIEIDLSEVEQLDSTAIQILLATKRCEGKQVSFINHSQAVLDAIAVTNLSLLLSCDDQPASV